MVRPRSAFNQMPGPGTGARRDEAPYNQPYTMMRGRVLRILSDRANKQPAFLIDVVPIGGGLSSGAPDNIVANVRILQPGFGSLSETELLPSGIITLPEIGSVCLCVRDDAGWVAIGWYTGPVLTALETQFGDPEHRAVSLNPGIETSGSRVTGMGGWDVPAWAFGIEPGDQLLGKGNSRIKVTAEGVVIGSGADNMELYRLDGGRLRVVAEDEERGVGFWRKRTYSIGHPVTADQYSIAKGSGGLGGLAQPPEDGTHYEAEVVETSPLLSQMQPYLLHQRGHIDRSMKDYGRQAVAANSPNGYDVTRARATDDYAIEKTTVVKSTSSLPTPAFLANELLAGYGFVTFDRQVDPDGSFRLRAGNPGGIPGGQGPDPTTQLSFTADYDARTNKMTIRLGRAGAAIFQVVVNGETGAADLQMNGPLKAKVGGPVELEAPRVEVKATNIKLDGNVEVTGTLRVRKNVTGDRDVVASRISLTKHTHNYTWTDSASPPGGRETKSPT